MIKNIEQEYPPGSWSLFDHINVFTKGLIIICSINGCICITFDVII